MSLQSDPISADEHTRSGEWPAWVVPGWYVAAMSDAVRAGTTREVTVAGRDLAVYRTASGRPVVVDRYCPHMGASLGWGEVRGETILCPFHHWAFDTNGKCTNIPYYSQIPPKARVRAYEVRERFGAIWMFVGRKRYYELPSAEEMFGGRPMFRIGTREIGQIRTSAGDLMANSVDNAHAFPVHHARAEVGPVKVRGHTLSLDFSMDYPMPPPGVYSRLRTLGINLRYDLHASGRVEVFGPSIWATFIDVKNFGTVAQHHVLSMVQPLGPRLTRLFFSTFLYGRPNPATRLLGELIQKVQILLGLHDDFKIYNFKTIWKKPMFVKPEADPIVFREWWNTLGQDGEVAEKNGSLERSE
jgi:phenylpropionate dioxygenase-like ring-hydroxylating dioxygenase large terminal subunit